MGEVRLQHDGETQHILEEARAWREAQPPLVWNQPQELTIDNLLSEEWFPGGNVQENDEDHDDASTDLDEDMPPLIPRTEQPDSSNDESCTSNESYSDEDSSLFLNLPHLHLTT